MFAYAGATVSFMTFTYLQTTCADTQRYRLGVNFQVSVILELKIDDVLTGIIAVSKFR